MKERSHVPTRSQGRLQASRTGCIKVRGIEPGFNQGSNDQASARSDPLQVRAILVFLDKGIYDDISRFKS